MGWRSGDEGQVFDAYGALMLLPNEFMPDHVRLAHFAELSLSNFVFGWVVVWLLTFNRAGIATPRVSRA
ncbi:MAG: hypothetical protein PHP20_09930 [Firmicutes bacterium]|nr:hypothetical protein [Bacillota bacterium]